MGAGAAAPGPQGGFGSPGGGFSTPGGAPAAPPAPPPIEISRVECGACSFQFIVGEVEVAVCPNCGAEVDTASAGGAE